MWKLRWIGFLALLVFAFLTASSVGGGEAPSSLALKLNPGDAQAPQQTAQTAQFFSFQGPGAIPPTAPLPARVLVAGNASSVWLVRPLLVDNPPDQKPGFQLLEHDADKKGDNDRDLWTLAQSPGDPPLFMGRPSQLALLASASSSSTHESAYVLLEDGRCEAFSLTSQQERVRLPEGEHAVSAIGVQQDIYVLARGPRTPRPPPPSSPSATLPAASSTTNPAAHPATSPADASTNSVSTQPAIASASASTLVPATSPSAASQAASPPAPDFWTLYHFTGQGWIPIELGPMNSPDVPAPAAQPLLLESPSSIEVFWIDPTDPHILVSRSCAYAEAQPKWSPSRRLPMSEPMTRLMGVSISPQMFVVWPVQAEGKASVELHGVALSATTPATMEAAHAAAAARAWRVQQLQPMNLGSVSAGIDFLRDVGIARTANSLMVAVAAKDGSFQSLLFDQSGRILTAPSPIEPQESSDSVLAQNVIMVAVIILFMASFWQWRRNPLTLGLPADVAPAELWQRAVAGGIDFAVALIAVILAFGLYRDNQWITIFTKWFDVIEHQDLEDYIQYPPLLWLFCGYVLYVMLMEIFIGRSLGKIILGMRVVAIDGSKPRWIAIVLRNLFRLPDLATGILFICMLLNPQHQRLGDWLSRTIVVRNETKKPEQSAN